MLASIIQPQTEPGGSAYGSVVKTPGLLRDTCPHVADAQVARCRRKPPESGCLISSVS